jgi:hypothetical protein
MADLYQVLTEVFQISFVIGEMKEPQHILPRVLNSSMAIVITLFVLSTFAFYNTLSLEVLQKTNAIAVVGRHSLMSFYQGYLNSISTADGRRRLAWRYLDNQGHYSTPGLCVYLVSAP